MFYVSGSVPDVNTDLPSGFSAAMIKGVFWWFWSGVGVGGTQEVVWGSQPVGRALATEDVEPVQPL